MSPTQKTLKWMREMGFAAQVVEKWNPHAKVRQDLFGFIDIVAIKEHEGIVGIQATSMSNYSDRIKKILDAPDAKKWILAGGRLMLLAWGKRNTLRSHEFMVGSTDEVI